jgi:hypothetical protein
VWEFARSWDAGGGGWQAWPAGSINVLANPSETLHAASFLQRKRRGRRSCACSLQPRHVLCVCRCQNAINAASQRAVANLFPAPATVLVCNTVPLPDVVELPPSPLWWTLLAVWHRTVLGMSCARSRMSMLVMVYVAVLRARDESAADRLIDPSTRQVRARLLPARISALTVPDTLRVSGVGSRWLLTQRRSGCRSACTGCSRTGPEWSAMFGRTRSACCCGRGSAGAPRRSAPFAASSQRWRAPTRRCDRGTGQARWALCPRSSWVLTLRGRRGLWCALFTCPRLSLARACRTCM